MKNHQKHRRASYATFHRRVKAQKSVNERRSAFAMPPEVPSRPTTEEAPDVEAAGSR